MHQPKKNFLVTSLIILGAIGISSSGSTPPVFKIGSRSIKKNHVMLAITFMVIV